LEKRRSKEMLRKILLAGFLCAFVVSLAGAQEEKAPQSTDKQPAPVAAPAKGKAVVLVETSMGNIKIELYPEKAPKSVENFLKYTKDGYYKDTIFHRVMAGFVIQGGGFLADMSQKSPSYPAIPLESQNGLKNSRGTVAMARTNQPNSATCQFYINLKDNGALDYNPAVQSANGYAVFGKVVEGLDVVDKIAAVATGTSGNYQNVPLKPVLMADVKQLP
jgi:cyclophilin family peptidyl-prolyl cis-trans isomerase